jgi:hypothetical protein
MRFLVLGDPLCSVIRLHRVSLDRLTVSLPFILVRIGVYTLLRALVGSSSRFVLDCCERLDYLSVVFL